MIAIPLSPSTMIVSLLFIIFLAFLTATMEGIFKPLARIAVCELVPPCSVMKITNYLMKLAMF